MYDFAYHRPKSVADAVKLLGYWVIEHQMP